VIPDPGRAVKTSGTKELFRIWIVVTILFKGDSVLFVVGTTVVLTVLGTVVITVVGTGVSTVVDAGEEMVVGEVVTGSGVTCWVHPVKATKAIRRIIKPKIFFMKSK
jgi:hypothetical protein